MDKPNNPPAFPVEGMANGDSVSKMAQGMTLLDYFAGKAVMGLISSPAILEALGATDNIGDVPAIFARKAYEVVQAMLSERDKHL